MGQSLRYGILIPLLFFGYWLQASCVNCESLTYLENKGQWPDAVQFRSYIPSATIFLEKDGITYSLYDKEIYENIHGHLHFGTGKQGIDTVDCHALKMEFLAGSSSEFEVYETIPEYFNFYFGKDPSNWASRVKGHELIIQKDVYQGIDVKWYSDDSQLKYDIVIRPEGDLSQLQLSYKGHDGLVISDHGDLLVKTSLGDMVESAPIAYQFIDGNYTPVNCNYQLNGSVVSFDLPEGYDSNFDLIIDPAVIFSTYSGSLADNFGYTATFDSKGNLYGGGSAFGRPGQDYPTTLGAFQTVYGGGNVDMGITKYAADGSTRIYSTYLGGTDTELPHSFFVNGQDELFIFGTTSSLDFPVTANAYDTTYNGGTFLSLANGLGVVYNNGSDMVISRFSSDGSQLLASTYLGGSENDGLNYNSILRYNYADQVRGEVFIDEDDNCYIASCSLSPDLPVDSNAIQPALGGIIDACLFKLDNDLTTVQWGTYIGGSLQDAAYSIVLDKDQNPYVVGGTRSDDLRMTAGSYQPTLPGGRVDGFIYHIDKSGQVLLHGTYYGFDSAYDQLYFVEKDNEGDIFVLGQTDAPGNSYVLNAGYSTPNSGQFISKFNPELDTLIFSVAFGTGDGSPDISPSAFLVDLCNKIYVAGWGGALNSAPPNGLGRSANSTTNNLDLTPSTAYQTTTDGNDFYLMVLEDDASILVYGSYFGGNQSGDHVDGGTSRFDRNGIVYQSVCASCGNPNNDFPIEPGPGQVVSGLDLSNGGTGNRCNNAVFKFDLELPLALANFDLPPSGCAPYNINFNNTSKLVDSTRAIFWWDFGDSTYSNLENPSHTYASTGVYEITLAVFDSSSCNLTDTITKQLIVLSNSQFNLDTTFICQGVNEQIGFNPTADTNITFLWVPSTGLNLDNIANPIANLDSSIVYQVFISNSFCTDTFIYPVGVFREDLEIDGDTIACDVDTFQFGVIRSGSAPILAYRWEPEEFIVDGQGTENASFFLQEDTVIRLQIVTLTGCVYEAEKRVRIFDYPLITAPLESNICPGDTTQVFVGNGFPQYPLTYEWQPDSAIIGSNTVDGPFVNPTESTMFYVTGDNGLGCVFLDSVLVVVPNGASSNLPPIIQCDTSGVQIGPQLSDSTLFLLDTSLVYLWQPGEGLSDSTIPNPIASVSGDALYIMTVGNGRCADTLSQEILFDANFIFLEAEGPYCLGDTANVSLNFSVPEPTYTVSWSPRPPVIGNPQGANATVRMDDTVTVFATVSLSNGCDYVSSIFLDLYSLTPVPVIASANPDSVDPGRESQLTANGPGIVSYNWTPEETIDSPSTQNPIATPREQTIYRVAVVDSNGCEGEDTTIVFVRESVCRDPFVYVPNAFSPNGDGDNDLLFVRGNNLVEMYFVVYDRWGEKVFETRDQSVGWDGTYNGTRLDPAVFAWYMEGLCDDGFEVFLKGDVTILR